MYKFRLQNATKVLESDLVSGNFTNPKPASQRDSLTLKISSEHHASVYAIIVKDEMGNLSPLSNVVNANLVDMTKLKQKVTDNSNDIAIGFGIGFGVLVLIIVIVAVIALIVQGKILQKSDKKKPIFNTTGRSHNNAAYTA